MEFKTLIHFLEKFALPGKGKPISKKLRAASSIEDLADVLNFVQEKLQKKKNTANARYTPKLVTSRILKYHLYSKKSKYQTFNIPKKSGGHRVIQAPNRSLKKIQRLLNHCFQEMYSPYPQTTGFVPKRSVVSNAQHHIGKKYIYNIDLKDFFPRISFLRVWGFLSKVEPFQLDNEVARIIASLCCHEEKLPQGAPTSPTLSNMICMRLDRRFYQLSQKLDFTYTRYADDITISSNENIFSDKFKKRIKEIIGEEGFKLNPKKERLHKYNVVENGILIREKQEVTGIIVNEKTNVNRKYIKDIRAILYNWRVNVDKYGFLNGYEKTVAKYQHFYQREKGIIRHKGNIPPMENYLHGKIQYLGMVRGKEDPTYKKMMLKLDSLRLGKEMSLEDLKEILILWKEEGIEKAMNKFYQSDEHHWKKISNDRLVYEDGFKELKKAFSIQILGLIKEERSKEDADIFAKDAHPLQWLNLIREILEVSEDQIYSILTKAN